MIVTLEPGDVMVVIRALRQAEGHALSMASIAAHRDAYTSDTAKHRADAAQYAAVLARLEEQAGQ